MDGDNSEILTTFDGRFASGVVPAASLAFSAVSTTSIQQVEPTLVIQFWDNAPLACMCGIAVADRTHQYSHSFEREPLMPVAG